MDSTLQKIIFSSRSITEIKFHRDGDVFFCASKDYSALMISTEGQVLGSFEGHKGALMALASENQKLLTGGLDLSLIAWDILRGEKLSEVNVNAAIRGIDHQDEFYFCTDFSMNKEAFIGRYDERSSGFQKLVPAGFDTTKLFKNGNYVIVAGDEGEIAKIDIRKNEVVEQIKAHYGKIADIRPSACRSFFSTASSDSTFKIIDSDSLVEKRRFESDEPVNCTAIFNTNDVVVAVGGIQARDVTTTRGNSLFETNFYDIVTHRKVGSYKTHFGTINTVDVHPAGTCYASAGEDGAISLVQIGDDFRAAPFTKFK
ncbi:translation initiation factor 3 subunit I [Enteropsectra breve]|nr:translation initiation factor 3 subunit I [Enteropsectra breve]